MTVFKKDGSSLITILLPLAECILFLFPHLSTGIEPVVLKQWAITLWESNEPFTRCPMKPSENTYLYYVIKVAKIQYEVTMKIIFMVGGHHTTRPQHGDL